MSAAEQLLTNNLSTLALAVQKKSASGRGSSKKIDLYGIKKLRELILELAVRGKLVPQNPDDEPASKLMERIETEKARLVKEKKIKKPRKQPEIAEDEKPYSLPHGWEWARLESLCPMSLFDGDWIESKDQDSNGAIRLVQLGDVGVNEFKDVSSKFINDEAFARLKCTELYPGDILIARLPSPIGRACIFPGLSNKAITAVDVAILRPLCFLNTQYVVHAINSSVFRKQVEEYGKGATRFRISTGNLKSILIPVAPLKESESIVAKVDELMALCDQIEQQTEASLSAHTTLVENLLATLTSSANAEELEQNWQRIASHFTTLFTTEASIDQLKQTILQLAVTGLLTQPRSEREIIDEGSIRIPIKWRMTTLNEISQKIIDCPHSTPKWTDSGVICVRTNQFKPGQLDLTTLRFVSDETYQERTKRAVPQPNDILYSREGGILGVACRIPEGVKLCLGQRMMLIRCGEHASPEFIEIVLNSPFITQIAEASTTGGAAPRVNVKTVKEYPVPLPSLEEQVQIVDRVYQLEAICDQIKTHLQRLQQTRRHLADAVVERAPS